MPAFTSLVNLSVSVSGAGLSESLQPEGFPLQNPNSPGGGPLLTSLAGSNNSITVPPGAQAILILPDSASTVAKTLKGANGDTGFALATNKPSLLSFPPGTTTLILSAASAETVKIHWL